MLKNKIRAANESRITSQRRATKRILLELEDLKKNPIEGIAAAPIEGNLLIWHINLLGPKGTIWETAILHAVLTLSIEYPNVPPTLQLLTTVVHPNVVNGRVCMDILDASSPTGGDLYWSPAYTIRTILLHLQMIVFQTNFEEITPVRPSEYGKKKKEWESSVRWSIKNCLNYKDTSVGHFPPLKPWPFVSYDDPSPKAPTLQTILDSDFVCAYTRRNYHEVILGYGVTFTKNARTGELSHVKVRVEDYISLNAFMNYNIRESSLHVPFTHFLPIIVDPSSVKKTMYLAQRALSIISTGHHESFAPEQALFILPKLMNTMILSMISDNGRYSTRSLIAFSHFHRLLLQFIVEFPQLQKIVDEKVKTFISDESSRNKETLPNIGEFLVLLSVSSFEWRDIEKFYLEESFTRGVFWIHAAYPELINTPSQFSTEDHLKYCFTKSSSSLKVLLFQLFFLRTVSLPNGRDTDKSKVASSYDRTFCMPDAELESLFLKSIQGIRGLESYVDFFNRIESPKSEDEIFQLLRESVKKSEEKGYHGIKSENILSPEQYSKLSRKFDMDQFATWNEEEQRYILLENDDVWKDMCETRWGFNSLPSYLEEESNPWRKLYLQNNLQDIISALNDVPDFPHFHKTCDISFEIPRIEVFMFNPNMIKSRYFFLTTLLTKLHNLNTLIIRKGSEGLSRKGFKALAKGLSRNKGKLENLILEHCSITSESISELTEGDNRLQSNVKRLSLASNPLGDNGATSLAKFLARHDTLPELEELDLSGCNISSNGARTISEILLVKRKLRNLTMNYNPMRNGLDHILLNLSYSTTIDSVSLCNAGNLGTGYNLSHLFDLTLSLRTLNLYKVNLSSLRPMDFQFLRGNTSIEELDLAATNFQQFKVLGEVLAQNTTLKILKLDSIGMNGNSLHSILTGFQEAFEDKKHACHVRNPEAITHLESLSMSEASLGVVHEDNEKTFGEFLSLCKKLEKLNLSKSGLIANNFFIEFAKVFDDKYGLKIRELNLRGNSFSKYTKHLTNVLVNNSTLEELDISGNDLGVRGVTCVAEWVSRSKSVKQLNLFGNFAEIEGCIALSDALKKNESLTTLDFGLNRIRERGCNALVEALRVNHTLTVIALKHNHLPDSSCMSLAREISGPNSKISFLSLAGNKMSIRIRGEVALRLSQASRPIGFDLSSLVQFKDPEVMERTILLQSFPKRDKIQLALEIKKSLYSLHVGAIKNVYVYELKKPKPQKHLYAFVEFAHTDSVTLAIQNIRDYCFSIAGCDVHCARAGTNEKKKDM